MTFRAWLVLAAVAGLACAACSSDAAAPEAHDSGSDAGGSAGGASDGGPVEAASPTETGSTGGEEASDSSAGNNADGSGTESGSEGAAMSSDGSIGEAGTNDAPAGETGGPLVLTSSAFKEGDVIPLAYKCAQGSTPQTIGMSISPPLSWTLGPAQTKSYAAVLVHLASDMSVHWVLWDVAPSVTSLPADIPKVANPSVPAGTSQMKPNVDGSTWFGYQGACPRPGAGTQRYEYSVYALDVAMLPGVTTQSTGMEVLAAVKAHQIAHATLSGTETY